jgi:hypothetical protein
MTWNYRIVRVDYDDESCYGIYEVYYDDKGKPVARTENTVGCMGEGMKELYESFHYMSIAFTKPVLTDKDFSGEVEHLS